MQQEEPGKPVRTRVYIDGYNFYYGCLKGTAFKWLDLYKLFGTHILPSALVIKDGRPVRSELLPVAIKFFTAKILEKAAKAQDSVSSQMRYHTALQKLYDGRIQLIEGYYSLIESKAKIVDAANPGRWPRDCQEITVWKIEEKQSDVSLALQAYHDAMTGEVDHVVIASNDTDLTPALELIRAHTKVLVGLVVPTRDHQRIPNAELRKHCHWVRTHVTDAELAAAQLPRVIPGRRPTVKPDSWYARPDLLDQVLRLATPVRGSRAKAFQWLGIPNPHLDGCVPLDLIETDDGAARVIAYMQDWIRQNIGTGIPPPP